jgi:hypothetical protein
VGGPLPVPNQMYQQTRISCCTFIEYVPAWCTFNLCSLSCTQALFAISVVLPARSRRGSQQFQSPLPVLGAHRPCGQARTTGVVQLFGSYCPIQLTTRTGSSPLLLSTECIMVRIEFNSIQFLRLFLAVLGIRCELNSLILAARNPIYVDKNCIQLHSAYAIYALF